MLKILKTTYKIILDTLFPERCIVCEAKWITLCDACVLSLPRAEGRGLEEKEVSALFDYKNEPVRKAIWMLKYKGVRSVARAFAVALYDELFERLENEALFEGFRDTLLIPLPLSPQRRRERGFNQSEYLAEELALRAGPEIFTVSNNILLKIKDTPSQTSLKNKTARLKNIKGCFAVSDAELVRGKNIILIDDVVTTGATIHEARKVLKKAGARRVIAIAVAH